MSTSNIAEFDSENEPLQAASDHPIIPQTPDTVSMAILCCIEHLPPDATVEQCLKMYCDLKLREIDELGDRFNHAFLNKLRQIENVIQEY